MESFLCYGPQEYLPNVNGDWSHHNVGQFDWSQFTSYMSFFLLVSGECAVWLDLMIWVQIANINFDLFAVPVSELFGFLVLSQVDRIPPVETLVDRTVETVLVVVALVEMDC